MKKSMTLYTYKKHTQLKKIKVGGIMNGEVEFTLRMEQIDPLV